MRIGFAGTPAFAAAALEAILDAGLPVAVALTQADRPRDRGWRPKSYRFQEEQRAIEAWLGLIVEAFEDAGIVSGLTHESARRLILSTVRGTAELLVAEDLACADLRRMVTSPGGTAAAGLAEMERRGVRGAIIDGVSAARHRAGELG